MTSFDRPHESGCHRFGIDHGPLPCALVTRENSLFNYWIRIFLWVLPLTSFLVLPSVQGTTPANILLIAAIAPLPGLIIFGPNYVHLARAAMPFLLISGIFFIVSRFSLLIDLNSLRGTTLVNPVFVLPLTMLAHVTQFLYLCVGVFLYLIFKEYYNSSWDKHILIGAWFLVSYALFDWFSGSFFKANLDFLSNRMFEIGRFSHPGSLRQGVNVLGMNMMRLKGFTGEPSMYAISALPYLAFAISKERTGLAVLLALSLALTVSSSAFLGLALIFGLFINRIRFFPLLIVSICASLFSIICIWIAGAEFAATIYDLFISKLVGESHSGIARSASFGKHIDAWAQSHPIVQLFGFGFGTVRSTDLFSTLLLNIGVLGVIGVIWFLALQIKNGHKAGRHIETWAVFSIILIMMLAVPEFGYLPPWMLLGYTARCRD